MIHLHRISTAFRPEIRASEGETRAHIGAQPRKSGDANDAEWLGCDAQVEARGVADVAAGAAAGAAVMLPISHGQTFNLRKNW